MQTALAEVVTTGATLPAFPVPLTSTDRNPAAVYIASLGSPNSRRAMLGALDLAARTLNPVTQAPWGAESAYPGPDQGRVMGREGFPWASVRYQHLAALRSQLGATHAPRTANLALAAVRGVAREAWRLGQLSGEEYQRIADVKGVKVTTAPRGRAMEPGELRAMLAACGTDAGGRRDAALLALLYSAGLRRAEAAALTLADYNAETGALAVLEGKGRKDRTAYVTSGARAALVAWLAVRGAAPGALFVAVHKSGSIDAALAPMTPAALWYIVQRGAAAAGVTNLSPHDFRRSFVSDLLDAGADISTVAQLAGHASVTTTARYDRRGEGAKRRAVELLHVPFEVR